MEDASENFVSLTNEEAGYETLQEIENQTSDNSRQKRAFDRVPYKSKVILQPGNSSEYLGVKVQGVIGNISERGCQAMFPVPVEVGDLYRIQFDNEQLDIPLTFVRCLRCRLISEDEFETGFLFLSPIAISKNLLGKKKTE